MAKRQVFYSFHFDNDVMRVQQIRNIGVIEGNEPVSPNKWEEIKRKGDNAIEKWIDENMKYIIEAGISTTINLCWSPLSTFTMPDLIEKYREWNELAISNEQPWGMNISLMQAAGKEWMHPAIFGPSILDWGYNETLDMLSNMTLDGWENPISNTLEYFEGIKKSIEECQPNKKAQQDLHKYLTELDRRRGTDYRELFPIIYEEIHKQ